MMKSCRECRREVSDHAIACPHCGAPYSARDSWDGWGYEYKSRTTVAGWPLFDDPDHSEDERRELIIGHSADQRLLIVSFTEREPRTRIIGAREATARERSDYEKNTPKRTT